jgi:riboflavin synthase
VFTGIVQEMGRVSFIKHRGSITRLGVTSASIAQSSETGNSISVNGICLTITSLNGSIMCFDLSGETLRSTNLEYLKIDDRVNLEPALRASDRLGGHIVDH